MRAPCEEEGVLVQCYLDEGLRVVAAPQGWGRTERRPTPAVKRYGPLHILWYISPPVLVESAR